MYPIAALLAAALPCAAAVAPASAAQRPLAGRLAAGAPSSSVLGTVRPAARSTLEDSLHWVGYTFSVGHVTGVRADWTEPTVHGKAGSQEFVWLGIGGWNQTDDNIIQDGTFTYFPKGGGRNEGVWYERVPQQLAQFPLVAVAPGDHIESSITLVNSKTHKWRMTLTDPTLGTHWAKTVTFRSDEAFPSFVVEDPDKGSGGAAGPFYPFPRWRSVTFSHLQIRVRGKWRAADKYPSFRVNMVRSGRTLATAGALSTKSDGFTARQK
jgi:Peptidase A4 family